MSDIYSGLTQVAEADREIAKAINNHAKAVERIKKKELIVN
jgi:hypothetical protein